MTPVAEQAYLEHVRDAIAAVKEYTAAGKDTFVASKMVQDAVIRNLKVIGEAVKGLSCFNTRQGTDRARAHCTGT